MTYQEYLASLDPFSRIAHRAGYQPVHQGVRPADMVVNATGGSGLFRLGDFIPGPQQLLAARDLREIRDARDEMDSLMTPDPTWAERGLFGGAELLAATGLLPMVGGATKPLTTAAKNKLREKTRKITRMRNLLKKAAKDPNISQSERDMLTDFGSKFEKEKALAAAVRKAERERGSAPNRSLKTGKSEAVAPDIYRQLEKEKGQEEVLRQVRGGKHLKRRADGTYVGGPRTVTSPQGLGTMRKHLDADFDAAVNAVSLADPARLGTWYDRAKAGQAISNTPRQLQQSLDAHGVFSAGVTPEAELGFALGDLNGRILGTNKKAYRGAGQKKMAESFRTGGPVDLEFKVGEYRGRNDPRQINQGLFGVNDFRRAQGMNYTDPTGGPWRAGVQATMHPFMDAETALQVDRANQLGIGGRTTWQGPHIQEEPWVYGKAQDYFLRGFEGSGQYNPKKYAGGILEAVKKSVSDANKTSADYFPKHTLSATHEAIPGAASGHVPGILDSPMSAREAYSNYGSWNRPGATMQATGGVVGAGNRDVVYDAIGFRQVPSQRATGSYVNAQGVVENQPLNLSNVLADYAINSHDIDPATVAAINAAEGFKAGIDMQEAFGWNIPKTGKSVKGRGGLLLEGPLPDANEMSRLLAIAKQNLPVINKVKQGQHGPAMLGQWTALPHSRGLGLKAFDYDFNELAQGDWRAAQQIGKQAQKVYPATPQKAAIESGYGNVVLGDDWAPLPPNRGLLTQKMMQPFVDLDPGVAQRIARSPEVRTAIDEKMTRDAALGARPDAQRMRAFFMSNDWSKIVDYARKNKVPIATAVAALGYSMSGLAAPSTGDTNLAP